MYKILLSTLVVLTLVSCKKNTDQPSDRLPKYEPAPYVIKEDFELNKKAAYAIADVTLKTGSWSFEDALLGNLTTDVFNDKQGVRIRAGKISTNFDIDSVTMIVIKHASYGTDANSQISVWVSENSGFTYDQVGPTITTSPTTFKTDTIKLGGIKRIRFQIRKPATTRVNIDDVTLMGVGNPGIVFNEIPDNVVDNQFVTVAAPGRGFPLASGIDVPPASGDNSNLLFGNPSNAVTDSTVSENYLIDVKYYAESYSSSRGTPNWVSWHLDATNLGTTPRQDDFAAFIMTPFSFYKVQSNSYSGSGFDRGHNCPSGDRTSSADANSATFLMTNMIPQAPNNNQKAWATLEGYLRAEVQKGNEVYIIMGSYGKGGIGTNGAAETINGGKVVVPSRVWKVAVIIPNGNSDLNRVNADTRILAVDTPNENTILTDWTKYITTIDAIEKSTKYDILSKLSTELQKVLQVKVYIP